MISAIKNQCQLSKRRLRSLIMLDYDTFKELEEFSLDNIEEFDAILDRCDIYIAGKKLDYEHIEDYTG